MSCRNFNKALAAAVLVLATVAAPPVRSADAPAKGGEGATLAEKLGQQVPLDATFKDEQGNPVTLKELLGRPTFITLNYYRCAGICTPQLNAIAELINRMPEDAKPGVEFRFISVSFDDTDTPELAARKRTNYLAQLQRPFPADGWRFLTGDAENIRKLTSAVGFGYEKQGTEFVHPAVFIAVSPDGHITRYMYGITYLPADVQMAAREALENRAMPSIAKYLRVCFTYDPAGQRYVVDTTRVAAFVTIGFALLLVLYLALKPKKKAVETRTSP